MVKVKEDLTGRRFGKLVALEQADDYVSPKGQHHAKWKCRCDCGNTVDVLQSHLLKNIKVSCGCISNDRHDITNQKFTKLTAIKIVEYFVAANGKRDDLWLCECECGTQIVCKRSELTNGKRRSCGCGDYLGADITGFRSGKLVAVRQVEDKIFPNGSHRAQWLCNCDCGQTAIVARNDLITGNRTSCGCVGRAYTERFGEQRLNCQGELMTVIRYRCKRDIDVRFETTGHVVHNVLYDLFKTGSLKDVMYPEVYGVGFTGGEPTTENGKLTLPYQRWCNMLLRCYDETSLQKQPTYRGCSVCKEWHDFRNFKKWFEENWYEFSDEDWNKGGVMALDKDLLHKGNKVYSPVNCVIVPAALNSIINRHQAARGDYPIGVSYCKRNGLYQATLNKWDESYVVGYYNTPTEAFKAYKQAKEKYIREAADYYKSHCPDFPQKLYDAMYAYEVEIAD